MSRNKDQKRMEMISGVDAMEAVMRDWEAIKEYVVPYVVNRERCMAEVEQNKRVYRELFDMLVLYAVDLGEDGKKRRFCTDISKEMLEIWKISPEELYEQAVANIQDSFRRLNFMTVIDAVIKADIMPKEGEKAGVGLWDLSKIKETDQVKAVNIDFLINAGEYLGAIGGFLPEVVGKVTREWGTNVLVLPESVHRTILVKEGTEMPLQYLKDMVDDANQEMPQSRVLTNGVYYYDRKADAIKQIL